MSRSPKEINYVEKFEKWNHKNCTRVDLCGQKKVVKCTQVYDGDTCWVAVFINDEDEQPIEVKVRMLSYDSPEIRTKDVQEKQEGIHCKEVLESLILGKLLFAQFGNPTHPNSRDKWGRCLATLSVGKVSDGKEGEIPITGDVIGEDNEICSDLINVNEYMIEHTRSYEYEGGTKRKFGTEY